ncbi:helix-turn-helix domain-containing protein [Streptomyces sp. DH37]|uniref:helix-turn-helix domain-containing protein n=1 Tax=Streptomyces sp. DH37 TaxID=3040122 RepID=UPI0034DE2604
MPRCYPEGFRLAVAMFASADVAPIPEIAAACGVPESTVRSWERQYRLMHEGRSVSSPGRRACRVRRVEGRHPARYCRTSRSRNCRHRRCQGGGRA